MSDEPLQTQLSQCLRRYMGRFDHLLTVIIETCDRKAAQDGRKPADISRIVHEVRAILAIDAEYKTLMRNRKKFIERKKKIRKLQSQLDDLTKKLIGVGTALSAKQQALYNYLAESARLQKSFAESPRVSLREVIANAQLIAPAVALPDFGVRRVFPCFPWMPSVDVMKLGLEESGKLDENVPMVAANTICMDEVETKRSAAVDNDYSDSSSEGEPSA